MLIRQNVIFIHLLKIQFTTVIDNNKIIKIYLCLLFILYVSIKIRIRVKTFWILIIILRINNTTSILLYIGIPYI